MIVASEFGVEDCEKTLLNDMFDMNFQRPIHVLRPVLTRLTCFSRHVATSCDILTEGMGFGFG